MYDDVDDTEHQQISAKVVQSYALGYDNPNDNKYQHIADERGKFDEFMEEMLYLRADSSAAKARHDNTECYETKHT